MCTVSFIGDAYRDRLWPPATPVPYGPIPADPLPDVARRLINNQTVTRAEFDELKRELEHLKRLLTKAKDYDQATGQPDCENDEKWELLKKIAEKVGVEL